MAEEQQQQQQQSNAKASGDLHQITVEDLYDKDKYDLSTMEQQDVMQILQYVSQILNAILLTFK
jgi:hypothetical protein